MIALTSGSASPLDCVTSGEAKGGCWTAPSTCPSPRLACSYGAFTHTSMGGREVQNQNLQKCMKVLRERPAKVPSTIRVMAINSIIGLLIGISRTLSRELLSILGTGTSNTTRVDARAGLKHFPGSRRLCDRPRYHMAHYPSRLSRCHSQTVV
eukprot:COSAG05_NODE_965_length_6403_cov_50.682741_6_plen_153_part_00